jgi:plastocyanin
VVRIAGWVVVIGALLAVAVAAPIKMMSKHVGSTGGGSAYAAGVGGTVHMAGLKFSPSALVVHKGTTVVFENNDVVPHTITEDTSGGADSGVLTPGKAFRLVVDGPLVYHCAIHPFMKASINLAG